MFAKLSQQDLYVSLNYDIDYSGAPEDWIERSGLPTSAEATVKGNGFSVLRQWMDPFRSVELNLSTILPEHFQPEQEGSVSDSLLKNSLNIDLASPIQFTWTWTKGLEFAWPELVERRIELKPFYKGDLERKGYSFIASTRTDSITVIGSKAYIDSISTHNWIAKYSGEFKGRGEHRLPFHLENPYPEHILIEPSRFQADVRIRRTTTIKRKIPITAKGFDSVHTLEMLPAFVECTLVIEFGEFDEMMNLPIIAFVRKEQLSEGRAPIELEFPKETSSALLSTDVSSTQVFILR